MMYAPTNLKASSFGAPKVACQRLASKVRISKCMAQQQEVQEAQNGQVKEIDGTETLETITDLLKLVDSTDIVELNITSSDFNFTAKKAEALAPAAPLVAYAPPPVGAPAYAPPVAPAPAPAAAPAPAPAAAAPTPPPAADAAPAGGMEVVSPMSGTFYRSPAPGEPPFCKEGDRVSAGQTVGIIEAMKLMNEIEAEVGGVVVSLLADNGDSVNPGQPLLIIKPE